MQPYPAKLVRNMKILLLCWRDSTHPQGGGSELYLERVGEYLARAGHEVIYRSAAHTDMPRRSVRDGVRYSRSGGKFTVYPKALLGILVGKLGLGTLANLDVVVDTQNGIPFFARLVFRPTVLLTHHWHKEQWPVAGPVLARVGWLLESKIAPKVYRGAPYVTVSQASKEDLQSLGVPDAAIIENGVDEVPALIPRLERRGVHIVTLSRLVPHKQIEHAIDALAGLDGAAELADDVVLDVIGSGWWEDKLRAYAAASGVGERVFFHGQVTDDYKHALLERAEVHVMPSRKEGWGLAVVEAAKHSVPTVGYSFGLRDSVGHGRTGLLADTPEQLTVQLQKILADDSLRAKLGAGARKFAEQFSWEKTGQRFAELLEDVVARDAGRG